MTTITNITEIESVRLTCKNCETAIVLPLKARNVPSECVNCESELPAKETKELISKLRFLKGQLQNANVTFELHLESNNNDR